MFKSERKEVEPVVATMPPVEYSVTNAGLAELSKKYATLPAATDKEGYNFIKSGIAEIRSLRTSVEARRKELKADALEYGRKVDGEAKRITEELLAIEDPMKQAKTLEDNRRAAEKEIARKAEEDRISALKERIGDMSEAPVRIGMDASVDAMRAEVARLKGIVIDETFDEFQDAASAARDKAIVALGDMIERRARFEAEQAQLEADRKQREEEEARMAKERAALDEERRRRDAEAERVRKEQEAALEAEREAVRKEREALAKERAERESKERAEQAEKDRAKQEELDRLRREKEEQEIKERNEREAREAAERAEQQRLADEASRPDREKLRDWIAKLRFIDGPAITDRKCLSILVEVQSDLDKLATNAINKIEYL